MPGTFWVVNDDFPVTSSNYHVEWFLTEAEALAFVKKNTKDKPKIKKTKVVEATTPKRRGRPPKVNK